MDNRRIEEALRDLPYERATQSFTARVAQRLEQPPRRLITWPHIAWPSIAAATALVLVALVAAHGWRSQVGARDQARLAALRAEHNALKAELAMLERLKAEVDPTIDIGGNETMRVRLALASWTGGSIRPEQADTRSAPPPPPNANYPAMLRDDQVY